MNEMSTKHCTRSVETTKMTTIESLSSSRLKFSRDMTTNRIITIDIGSLVETTVVWNGISTHQHHLEGFLNKNLGSTPRVSDSVGLQ